MTVTSPDHDWVPAEAVAAARRADRLHPSTRRRRFTRALLVVAITAWLVATVLAAVGFGITGDDRFLLGLIGTAAMLLYLVFGLIWAGRSGAYLSRGSPRSIQGALPRGTWPSVRRQLAGREPVDPDHRDVVTELARQQRDLLAGQAVIAGFYVPLLLNVLTGDPHLAGWPAIILALGYVALLAALVFGSVAYRRFSRLVGDR